MQLLDHSSYTLPLDGCNGTQNMATEEPVAHGNKGNALKTGISPGGEGMFQPNSSLDIS